MRLLQFDVPGCEQFYMRFGLFSPLYTPIQHPVLAICNSRSKIFFWDLRRLEEYHAFTDAEKNHDTAQGQTPPKRPTWLNPGRIKKKDQLGRLRPEGSPVESTTTTSSSAHTASSDTVNLSASGSLEAETATNRRGWDRKYFIGDPQQGLGSRREETRGLEPHKTESILRYNITGRQVAWSPGGEWCVVVGSPNVIAIFQRWTDGRGLGCG
jgi:polycomb protein EED